jgi:hypothetical protein
MEEIMKTTTETVADVVTEDIVETVVTPELKQSGIDAMFVLKTGAIALAIGGVIYIIRHKDDIKAKAEAKKEKKAAKKLNKLIDKLAKYGLAVVPAEAVEATTVEAEDFEEDDLEK